MSDLEPRKRSKKDVALRHIPSVVVPVPLAHSREFLHAALTPTTFGNPLAQAIAGWVAFEPFVRFTPVDADHTRIELDLTERVAGADILMFNQRRGEIDRFFVAIQDELSRRERWKPRLQGPSTSDS